MFPALYAKNTFYLIYKTIILERQHKINLKSMLFKYFTALLCNTSSRHLSLLLNSRSCLFNAKWVELDRWVLNLFVMPILTWDVRVYVRQLLNTRQRRTRKYSLEYGDQESSQWSKDIWTTAISTMVLVNSM